MHAVTPITIELFGEPRQLRGTPGARKLLVDEFGVDVIQNLVLDANLIAPVLYALMHDEEGNPPKDITVKRLQWGLPVADNHKLVCLILSVFTNGEKKKEDFEAELSELQEIGQKAMKERFLATLTGSNSSDSTPKSSDLHLASSGGDTSNVNSTPAAMPTRKAAAKNVATRPSSRGQSVQHSQTRSRANTPSPQPISSQSTA